MLNVSKKVENLRQNSGGEKVESLAPPKNLPDLARDLYERDQKTVYTDADKASVNVQSVPANSNISSLSRQVSEPNKDSVPGLDMSLVRQHLAASQSVVQSVQPQLAQQSNYQSVQQPVQQQFIQQPIQPPVQQTVINPVSQLTSQLVSPSSQSSNIFSSIPLNSSITDDTGFFKEFEEYVRNNGLNNDIVEDLLDKNLLEHMMFYHTTKGEDMPFYASSAELSHAIKVKLEELQNFERSWISNKQKLDLLKKWSSTIESDIHLRSEELKKLMGESRRRNLGNKSADFFQIAKSSRAENISASVASSAVTPVAPSIASSVYRPSVNVSSSITPSMNTSINVTPKSPVIPPVLQQQQSVLSSKFVLNNYVTHDPSKFFYSVDGQAFKSLHDLMVGLDSMSRETFDHHVNPLKNDFANWIKGVFNDFKLADALRSQNDREGLWYFLKNNTY